MKDRIVGEGLTFDDVLLLPGRSTVLPSEVEVRVSLTPRLRLHVPLISAAMDTVTEARLSIALARTGGLGIVHKNLTIKDQAGEVDKVKRSESGMIADPITLPPTVTVGEALDVMARYRVSGIPITENGRLVGILTNRDLRFIQDRSVPIDKVMTKEDLVTAPVGTTLEEAKSILHRNRIEKLLVVDDAGNLKGLITVKDILKKIQYPDACVDSQGRLRVGAAVGISADFVERAQELAAKGCDLLALDSAHGHSQRVMDCLVELRKNVPASVDIVCGNVATAEATRELCELGANVVKVGMGPGAICTTRVVAGIGVPQITAVSECSEAAAKFGVRVIADGGIRYSGDIPKAIAAGASAVMIGNLFAGTEESPGETVLYQGRSYKVYRGMGSIDAMQRGSGDRYFQPEATNFEPGQEAKLVAEGIEGRVPFKGSLAAVVYQLIGGLRAGMGYCGVSSIEELRTRTKFIRVTEAGMRESHPHDISITKEAPNYKVH